MKYDEVRKALLECEDLDDHFDFLQLLKVLLVDSLEASHTTEEDFELAKENFASVFKFSTYAALKRETKTRRLKGCKKVTKKHRDIIETLFEDMENFLTSLREKYSS